MTKIFDAVATIRQWTDKDTGTKHKATLIVGAVFQSSKGNQVLKLDALPLARDWSGWVALKPCAPVLPPGRKVSRGMPVAPAQDPQPAPHDEDEPPF
jgi:hypothetical protein